MGFNGDLYPTAGATSVMTTKGDIVRYDSERERYGIGSAGQVLQVASSLPTWSTINLADSVLTTQGDVLYEGASALARLGQSTDNYTLATKGAGANPAWQASSTSTLTAQGDLLTASGANTLSRLARGSDNQVLTMNGTALNWETPSGGGAWESVGTVSGTALSELTLDVADHDIYMLYYNLSADASAGSGAYTSMQVSGASDANYRSSWTVSSGGAFTTAYNTGATMWKMLGADLWNYATNNMAGFVYITKPLSNSMEDWIQMRSTTFNMSPTGTNYFGYSFGSYPATSISSIQMLIANGANIQGAFTVNAMDLE